MFPSSVPAPSLSVTSSAMSTASTGTTASNTSTCASQTTTRGGTNISNAASCIRSHLAILSATQSNIGTRFHRQNDPRQAMQWYLESIRTRAALYKLPAVHDGCSQAEVAQAADNTPIDSVDNNNNCNLEVVDNDLPPSPRQHKRRRVDNQSTACTSSHDGDVPTSSQHYQHAATTSTRATGTATGADSADDELAFLLVKYLYEATAIEAIEASSGATVTTDSVSSPRDSTRASDTDNTSSVDISSSSSSNSDDDDNDDDDDSTQSYETDHEDTDSDDSDAASFDSSPLDEDEEEELSSFLQTNDIVSYNHLSVDTTGRFIGLNNFTSPITIDLSNGTAVAGHHHQQEKQGHPDASYHNNSSVYVEYDIVAHAAITLFNMSLLHQQDGTDLDSCRRCLEVALQLLPSQQLDYASNTPDTLATTSVRTYSDPLRTCLAIMLHTNLGYISFITDDNDAAMKHFTMAFSVVCSAVQQTNEDIKAIEAGAEGSVTTDYLQAKRAYLHCYYQVEVAALLNVARCCEADGLYEIALKACTSAIQRLQSLPSLSAGTVPSSSNTQASKEEIALTSVLALGSAHQDMSSSLDLHSATFVMASIHSQLANDEEALRYYVAYFQHITDRYGPDHPRAIAAVLGINVIQLLTRDRMSLAAGAA